MTVARRTGRYAGDGSGHVSSCHQRQMQRIQQRRITMATLTQLERRLIAAGWFAVAAALAILVNPFYWWLLAKPLSDPSGLGLMFMFVLVPALCAAAVAAWLGAGILDATRVRS